MNSFIKGTTVAALHILIVLIIGGKFLYDRHHDPHVWVRAASIAPEMPVRGSYLALNLIVEVPGFNSEGVYNSEGVRLSVENGKLVASPTSSYTGLQVIPWRNAGNNEYLLSQSVPFFIPEHAPVPLGRAGRELWAEVTVPRKGPPRPIQLAIKNGNDWQPLNLH